MALNRVRARGRQLQLPVASGKVSGDPAVSGQIPGVCLTDRDSTSGKATLQLDGVFDISVKAIDAGGNSAVAVGDILYYTAADTPQVSKKATGVRFGYALEAITGGNTDTINVKVGY